MRKRTILDENYMALEQSIAQALDTGAITEAAMPELAEDFFNSPEYINFKNSELVERYFENYTIQKNIAESVKLLKTKNTFSLEEASLLSQSYSKYTVLEAEDEVEKLSLFFGGKDNIDIPDSDGAFNVVVTEQGILKAINSFGKLLEQVQIQTDTFNAALREQSIEKLLVSMVNMSILDEAAKVLLEFDNKALDKAQDILKHAEKDNKTNPNARKSAAKQLIKKRPDLKSEVDIARDWSHIN